MVWLFAVLAHAQAPSAGTDHGHVSGAAPAPKPAPKPAPPAPAPPSPPKPSPDEPITPDDDDNDAGLGSFKDSGNTDLLGDENQTPTSGDSEAVYRAAMAKFGKYEPDEELAGWEAYLAQYPNSVFRPRIEARMDQLSDAMYATGIQDPKQTQDANKKELDFAEGLQLENIDPRSRLSVGFEMGLPNYVNLEADYEGQVVRNLSFHGGVLRRYTGFSVEGGVHWALVKSLRTQTLVTVIGDARLNTIPAFPALRPQLALGKRFGKVDLQLQGGADVELRGAAGGLQAPIVGGASLFYNATPKVGVFAETETFMKEVGADGAFHGGLFRFNVVSFGMRFFPTTNQRQQVNLGATLPYMQQWWQFHYGSIMGVYDYYMN